ncbi:hypothetical protein pb186bvf_001754 [Paramecium bursaria]
MFSINQKQKNLEPKKKQFYSENIRLKIIIIKQFTKFSASIYQSRTIIVLIYNVSFEYQGQVFSYPYFRQNSLQKSLFTEKTF